MKKTKIKRLKQKLHKVSEAKTHLKPKKFPANKINPVKDGIKNKLFPVVAIGASAGGLEAYTELLKNLNVDAGMAYVIIQHLDPHHSSFLPEIIGRETSLKVNIIKKEMKPEPNNVYIIQPNTDLIFKKGKISSVERQSGHHMPVDIFMRSLAEDNTHYPIGVLLSGTDSDGVIGMSFIKAAGGITYAQDKASSKFFDMPRNAIKADVVDFIMPPGAIARELARILRNNYLRISNPNDPEEVIPGGESEINKIFTMLNSNNGVDFSDYKPTTIKRRILRRMIVHKIENIKNYVQFLKKNPKELDLLYDDVLINVTSFFREPGMFEALKQKVFPEIFQNKDRNTPVRIWVTGCSTGEEAYSMAISLSEFKENRVSNAPIQIFATDLSDNGIEKARAGIYPEDIRNDLSEERLNKYFIKIDGKYQIIKNIRDLCVFAKQNVTQDPPFSKIDLISCRNVLIYLGQVLQNKVLPVFNYSLNNPGYLVLGSSETVGQHTGLFEIVDKKNKLFRKKSSVAKLPIDFSRIRISHPVIYNNKAENELRKIVLPEDDYKKIADIILLNKFIPASVIVNGDLDIIHFRGKTGSFLEFPPGEPTLNLLKVAREGLAIEIQMLFKKIKNNNRTATLNNVEINSNGSTKRINLSVTPVQGNGIKEKLYLVVFEEVYKPEVENHKKQLTPGKEKTESQKILVLRNELEKSQQSLQSNIEQVESSNEELRAANEEIQSSNEELQSTNEELETAKEELQSGNEELSTVNDELHSKNDELITANNDLNNLLSSINIPILILDKELYIRRFTSKAEKLLNLIPSDVGRKITDIKINIKPPDLKNLVTEVIETPVSKEFPVEGNENSWYLMRIRPYLTLDKKIEGVIIAFIDITELRQTLITLEKSKNKILLLNINLEKRVEERTKKLRLLNENLNVLNKKLNVEINERKHAEESLKILSKHLVNVQETERHRLSRELHDSINQLLSVVKMKLYSTEKLLKKNKTRLEPLKDVLDAKRLLETAINEVRSISKNLRPIILEELNLKSALQSVIEEFVKRTKISMKFSMTYFNKKLPAEAELHIYRIVQEALHNIEKHSKAASGSISISGKNSSFLLNIRDNGKGFASKAGKLKISHNKFGLIGMKERTESIGGAFNVISLKGKGTEIKVTVPLKPKKYNGKTKYLNDKGK